MAVVIGSAGASARRNWFIDLVVPPFIFFVVFSLISPLFLLSTARIGLFWVFVQSVVGLAAGALIWRKQFREIVDTMRGASNWAKGADGEALTAAALSTLPDTYVVFHDFHPASEGIASSWNLDHVVIGPNGAFIVETKNYTRRNVQPASRNKFSRKSVEQVRRNSIEFKGRLKSWSAKVLSDVYVVPLLVYVQDGAFVEKTREDDVRVIPLKWLANEVSSHNSRRGLDPDEIYRIANVMFLQMEPYLMDAFRAELDRFGAKSRQFKLDRASARTTGGPAAVLAEATSPAPLQSADTPPTVCPNCGGQLVQRTARKGPRSGKRFLGCANYKDAGCGFIYNLGA